MPEHTRAAPVGRRVTFPGQRVDAGSGRGACAGIAATAQVFPAFAQDCSAARISGVIALIYGRVPGASFMFTRCMDLCPPFLPHPHQSRRATSFEPLDLASWHT